DEFAINGSGRQLFSVSMIEKMLENPEIHYFVYSDHQQMIGVIAYKNPAHLVHFFISKEKQAQGIGRTMWDFILQEVKKSGVSVFTVNSSCNAQPVYERFGFVVKDETIENHGLRYVPMSLNLVNT
ncbi:MAG: GNAT family N-acetyltransferase, partial [Acinetobacter sp.]|nr:GNAT family N-acetyltransferase [Acinetobacter sp.]